MAKAFAGLFGSLYPQASKAHWKPQGHWQQTRPTLQETVLALKAVACFFLSTWLFPFGKAVESSPSNCPSVVPCRLWLQGGDGGLQLLENGVRNLARSHLHLLRW